MGAVDQAIDMVEGPVEIVVEDAVDGIVEVVSKTNPLVLVAVGVTGLAIGAAGGYFVALKRLQQKFEDELSEEIDATKRFYSRLHKVGDDGEPLTPIDVLEQSEGPEAAAAALRNYQGRTKAEKEAQEAADDAMDEEQERRIVERAQLHSVSVVAEEPNPAVGVHPIEEIAARVDAAKVEETRNTFDDSFDYDAEVRLRKPTEPYIITHDEFYENEPNHDQSRLTYFEKDNTLADENDKPMQDWESLIGPNHLLRFGSGSKNENVVYVRNDKVDLDWEITRSTGSYVDEVLNMLSDDEPDSLRHANRNAQQRLRREFRSGER